MHAFFYYGRYFSVILVNLLILVAYQYEINSAYDPNQSQASWGNLIEPTNLVDVARGPLVYFNFICYVYLLFHLSIIDGLPIIRSRLRSMLQVDSGNMRSILFRDCSLSFGLGLKGPFHVLRCVFALFSDVRFVILGSSSTLCLYMVSDHQNMFSTISIVPLLLELISSSSLVRLAIGSVTKRWRLLCQVFICTVLFIYWCSCVVYVFFYRDLEFSVSRVVDGSSPPFQENEYYVAPRHLWKCFVFVLDNSLRTQDIGKAFGILQSSESDDELLHMPMARIFVRFAISFLFWFVFQLIFLRVFPGVISDTFKDNRLTAQYAESVRSSKCFICGLDSHIFTRIGASFDKHLTAEHAPYDYMRYFIYLSEKDVNEYTGLESFVVRCILGCDVSFLPIGLSLSLQSTSASGANVEAEGVDSSAVGSRLREVAIRQKKLSEVFSNYSMRFEQRRSSSTAIVKIRQEDQLQKDILKSYAFKLQMV
jgi:hypothetical protein